MINIPGQLAIRTINGRNGEFNVGKLSTSIGEFVIKDALLDQHIEGKYRGDFAITEIRPSYYTTGGRLVVEIRAKLDSMTLDDVDNLSDEEAERLSGNEVDPLDEVPAIQQPTAAPAAPPKQISCFGGAASSSSRQGVPRSSRAVFSMTTLNFVLKVQASACARSQAVRMPIMLRCSVIRRPMPHTSPTSQACSNRSRRAGSRISNTPPV